MIRHLMLCPVVSMCSAMADVWLTTSSCVGARMSRCWALGKFGEHERGVRVARGVTESNSSLMSAHECSPNFSSAQYLDIRTDEAWTNCFITLSKRSMPQLTLNFYYCGARSSSTRQCVRDYIFLPHSSVFVMKLRESLLKSLKITFKRL